MENRTSLLGLAAIASLASLVCACASTPQGTVQTTETSAAEIEKYASYCHTAAEQAPAGYAKSEFAADAVKRVETMIDAELSRRGYVKKGSCDDASMTVRTSTGRRAVVDAPTKGAQIRGASGIPETEGGLVIDLFDRASKAQVFHGYAHGEIDKGKVEDATLQAAVAKILERVPRSKQAPAAP